MIARIFLHLLLFSLCLTSASVAGDFRIYAEVAGDAVLLDENKKLKGSVIEIVNELRKRVDCAIPIEPIPWKRGYDALVHESNVALIPTTMTEKRKDKFQWVGPILRTDWVLVANKSADIRIDTLDDARHVGSIGTNIGDARECFLQNNGFTNIESTTSNILNFRKLRDRRVDLVLATTAGMEASIRDAGLSRSIFEIVYHVKEVDLFIAFSNDISPLVVARWRSALKAMQQDGTFQSIYEKWYPGAEPPLIHLEQ